MQFKESLIAKGLDGGKTAAYALRNAILQDCGDYASDVEVVAKVVANVGGLAKAMKRDGSLENDADLKDFTLGFTQCMASFDFVDIGYGKERADSKIKGKASPTSTKSLNMLTDNVSRADTMESPKL